MKIKVSVTDKGHTSVIVDGVELNMLAEGFTLSQNAGEITLLLSQAAQEFPKRYGRGNYRLNK